MDPRVARYLDELTARLRTALGGDLVTVAAVGSVALDAWVAGRSDVDVLVVAGRPLDDERAAAIAERCSHAALPCPGRKLELVVYTRDQVAAPRREQRWELNLNTGPGEHAAERDPAAQAWHWFVLDLAQARHHAVPLHGPHPAELIGAVPDGLVADALTACVAWYAAHEPGPELVLAAARAWRWHADGVFLPKAEAWRRARADPRLSG